MRPTRVARTRQFLGKASDRPPLTMSFLGSFLETTY
jgi:hypothetical protein